MINSTKTPWRSKNFWNTQHVGKDEVSSFTKLKLEAQLGVVSKELGGVIFRFAQVHSGPLNISLMASEAINSWLCGHIFEFFDASVAPPKSVLFILNPNQGSELGVLPHQCSMPKTKSQLLAVSNKNATLIGTTNDDPGPYFFGEISSQLKMNEPSKPMEWKYWSSWKWPQISG